MKNNQLKAVIPLPDNYGLVTDISKELNAYLGDKTGRSISMRTSHGFKNSFKLKNIHDSDAELIIHSGILAIATLLSTKNINAKGFGLALLIILMLFYRKGKSILENSELKIAQSDP